MTLSLTHIRHWRKKLAANERETYTPAELDSALAAAEALARLHETLISSDAHLSTNLVGFRVIIDSADEHAPDLLTALTRALDQAEAGT